MNTNFLLIFNIFFEKLFNYFQYELGNVLKILSLHKMAISDIL